MKIQNSYKHLHYLLCLGAGLRRRSSDIVNDALPQEMRFLLDRLSPEGGAAAEASTQQK